VLAPTQPMQATWSQVCASRAHRGQEQARDDQAGEAENDERALALVGRMCVLHQPAQHLGW
jgi:hypothetical protein